MRSNWLDPFGVFARETVLRRLTIEDASLISDLHALGFQPAWGTEDMLGLLQDKNVFGFLAVDKNVLLHSRPLGFVLARNLVDEAEILTIAVDPRGRGRGTGKALMREVLRTLYADRKERLVLEVDEGNDAALTLYRRLGFQKVGERKGYYSAAADSSTTAGKGATALVMACTIR